MPDRPNTQAEEFISFYHQLRNDVIQQSEPYHYPDSTKTLIDESIQEEVALERCDELMQLWRALPELLQSIDKGGYDAVRDVYFGPLTRSDRKRAVQTLWKAFDAANVVLWWLAGKHNLDGDAILNSGHVCEDLLSRDYTRLIGKGDSLFWGPDLLDKDAWEKLDGRWRWKIEKGSQVFKQLNDTLASRNNSNNKPPPDQEEISLVREAIEKHGISAAAKSILKAVKINKQKCLNLLRELERRGEYQGFRRCRPARYTEGSKGSKGSEP